MDVLPLRAHLQEDCGVLCDSGSNFDFYSKILK